MERWRVIDCSSMEGSLRAHRGTLEVIRAGSDPVSVPVADVAVVLVGISVSFSAAVIHRLLSNDIAVIFCDWKGVPEGAAHGNVTHGRVGARHQSQARLSAPRRKNAWGRIVAAKISGQAQVLRDFGIQEFADLKAMAHDVRSGDPANFEAAAARIYWNALWGHEGFTRQPGKGNTSIENRTTDRNFRNDHLDYAYTILRGHGIRAVMAAGLSPAMGIFHRGRGNYFALVDDLIEPFRPSIDWAVGQLSSEDRIDDPAVRKTLVEASSQRFSADGSRIPTVFTELAQQYGRYIEGEINRLPVPTWQGPRT